MERKAFRKEGFTTLFAEDEFWVLQTHGKGLTCKRTRVEGRQFRKPSKGFRKGGKSGIK